MKAVLVAVVVVFALVSAGAGAEPVWQTVLTDPTHAQEKISPENPVTAPDVKALDVAHAGGSRLLWRIRFHEQFEPEDTVLILYLDTDSDESTGRTGFMVQGTDRMLSVVNGEFAAYVHGTNGLGRRSRAVIDGDTVTITDDLDLLSKQILAATRPFEARLRARVFCHKGSVPNDSDDTEWTTAAISIDPSVPRPRDPGEPVPAVEDLSATFAPDGRLLIRFTTAENLSSKLTGPGMVQPETEGMVRNHAWNASSPGRYRITLHDETDTEVASKQFTVKGAPKPLRHGGGTGTVEVHLDYDRALTEATSSARHSVRWPASGGVPFSQGVLFSAGRVRLLAPSGEERTIQTEVAALWPDGSIRWLLVEFAANLPEDLEGAFRLEFGGRPRQEAADQTKYGLLVDWSESLKTPDEAVQRSYTTGTGHSEQSGPIRNTLIFSSQDDSSESGSAFGSRVRVHTYPGLPVARIEHTLAVERGDPMARLASLTLSFPAEYTFVAVRNRKENWPCEVATENGGHLLHLLPELKPDEYANRPESEEISFYWFDESYYKLRRGLHKTYEVLVAKVDETAGKALAFWLDNPPVLRAGPEYVCSTGAAGPLLPRGRTLLPKYEDRVKQAFEVTEKRRKANNEFGFMNFGDWFGERGRNWGNLEYDFTHALWLEWLRSGDYAYFRRADEAARHQSDIDIVHSDPDPANVGRVWGHSMGHTGGYYPDGAFGMETFSTRGFWDTGHTWCEGLLHMYLATGRRRFLENGVSVAGQLAVHETSRFRMHCERNAAWPIISLVAAYESTRDPLYLNGAKIIAREAMSRQDKERGGWFFRIGECTHTPAHVGGKPFMSGLLAAALSRLHRVMPVSDQEDRVFREQVGRSVVRGCDWLLEEAWLPRYNGFFYAQCTSFDKRPCNAAPWMVCEALAYATHISGDHRYADTAVRAVDRALRRPQYVIGKHLAMEMRSAPHFLAMVSSLWPQ